MDAYRLAVGDRAYSSWSLRGWLLFENFGLPVETRLGHMTTPEFAAVLSDFAPARLVPAALIGGRPVWDTLAIAETLAERHPGAGHWPADPGLRGLARSLAAEMHSGFGALRSACPMYLLHGWSMPDPPEAVRADLARLERLWAFARAESGAAGPWLFGAYGAVDAFFAPVAARIAGYGLPVGPEAAAYVAAHLADPAFRRWRAMGVADTARLARYEQALPQTAWPGPAPLPARAVAEGEPVNAACPYSGKPVAADSLAEIDGQVVGFCNTFCRDKTVVDPLAWPSVAALLGAGARVTA